MKAFIMAEISKCNGNDNTLSFVDALNTTYSMDVVCPVGSATGGRDAALGYFRQIMWDKFKNPYNPKKGVIIDGTDITSAKTAATDATVATVASVAAVFAEVISVPSIITPFLGL